MGNYVERDYEQRGNFCVNNCLKNWVKVDVKFVCKLAVSGIASKFAWDPICTGLNKLLVNSF